MVRLPGHIRLRDNILHDMDMFRVIHHRGGAPNDRHEREHGHNTDQSAIRYKRITGPQNPPKVMGNAVSSYLAELAQSTALTPTIGPATHVRKINGFVIQATEPTARQMPHRRTHRPIRSTTSTAASSTSQI